MAGRRRRWAGESQGIEFTDENFFRWPLLPVASCSDSGARRSESTAIFAKKLSSQLRYNHSVCRSVPGMVRPLRRDSPANQLRNGLFMSANPATEKPLSEVLIDRWEHVAQKVAELVEELPVEKLEWAPVMGLRNCGDVLRHVAFWNGYVTASLRGRHFSDAPNQPPAADYPTKVNGLAVLRSGTGEVAAAAGTSGRPDA
jgi:hypothetical protein